MPKKLIYVATNNHHKIAEISEILPEAFEVRPYLELGNVVHWIENGATFAENSFIKSRQIARKTNAGVLADDSGLCVYSLNLRPGVISARYSGENATDQANRELLLRELQPFQKPEQRKAYFATVVTFIDATKNEFLFEGRCEGHIALSEKGDNGFGYDSLFIPQGYSQTFAEISPETKNKLSHRYLALKKLMEFLRGRTET